MKKLGFSSIQAQDVSKNNNFDKLSTVLSVDRTLDENYVVCVVCVLIVFDH